VWHCGLVSAEESRQFWSVLESLRPCPWPRGTSKTVYVLGLEASVLGLGLEGQVLGLGLGRPCLQQTAPMTLKEISTDNWNSSIFTDQNQCWSQGHIVRGQGLKSLALALTLRLKSLTLALALMVKSLALALDYVSLTQHWFWSVKILLFQSSLEQFVVSMDCCIRFEY